MVTLAGGRLTVTGKIRAGRQKPGASRPIKAAQASQAASSRFPHPSDRSRCRTCSGRLRRGGLILRARTSPHLPPASTGLIVRQGPWHLPGRRRRHLPGQRRP
jgi:hypothetical protein